MRMVIRGIPMAALALCLGVAQMAAQVPGNGTFQWYVGGSGGILSFETATQGRTEIPMAGAHLLVTAKRTGLLLSVENGFGDDEQSGYLLSQIDSLGNLANQAIIPITFSYVRKYSATLMAFPIRGPATPFFGIGVGILHTGGHQPEDSNARDLGSTGFGSLVAGLNFQVSRFSAFGQYQVTTGATRHANSAPGNDKSTLIFSGNLLNGPTHTFSAGLRFSLGSARESVKTGGY
jgi:hypothetical protein